MQHNLLQKMYDKQCDMFLNGYINLETFMYLESLYNLKYKLFIINLN